MAFHECEFPRQIGFTSTGGAAFNTTVNTGMSGYESRNQNWSQSKGQWQLVLTARPQADFDNLFAFYLNVGGKADAFRLFWPVDYLAAGQAIGIGNGTQTQFQLQKQYISGSRTYSRIVQKPITSLVQDFQGNFLTDTVVVYQNAVVQSHAVGYHGSSTYTLDETSGVVTFGTAPLSGSIVTADFQFHLPVRFDVDDMTNLEVLESDVYGGNALISWSQLNLTEIRIEPVVLN